MQRPSIHGKDWTGDGGRGVVDMVRSPQCGQAWVIMPFPCRHCSPAQQGMQRQRIPAPRQRQLGRVAGLHWLGVEEACATVIRTMHYGSG